MQDFTVGDIGILFSAISIALTILGMFLAWLSERRRLRRSQAMDAVANRLLPFYSLVLKSIARIDLFATIANKVNYHSLRIDPAEFYEKSGSAFVYITEDETRQIIMNVVQVLEGLDLLPEETESQEVLLILSQVLPLLISLKNHIELYLSEYAKSLNVSSPKHETWFQGFDAQLFVAESALKEVIRSINAPQDMHD